MRIDKLIKREEQRQKETLMMIPSENYTYPEVRKAVGSVLMQKYAEGQPDKRYYQGMKVVDDIEKYCEDQALKAFRLSPSKWSVNVQPYSGTPANLAVYNAILKPGDKILAMYLPDGGHLSHGWEYKGKKITLVSKIFKVKFYHVNKKTLLFDYDEIERIAKTYKPKLIISGGTAYPREINHKRMGEIAKKTGGYYLADIAHEAGLVAAGINSSPFPHAHFVTMTTHKTLRGPRGALAFARKRFEKELDSSVFPGLQGGPHMHTVAGIAIALEKTQTKEFIKYAGQVIRNAKRLANKLSDLGYTIVSGGTDKHLVLVDLRNKKLNGWFVAWALEYAGIVGNRNTIPYDSGSPYYPSGLRLGTPAISARGMKESEIDQIAEWINEVIEHIGTRVLPIDPKKRSMSLKKYKEELENDTFLLDISKEIRKMCRKFPIL
jgi:glycine hydroxymethyltransferase